MASNLTRLSLEEKQQVEELDCIANRFDDRVDTREERGRESKGLHRIHALSHALFIHNFGLSVPIFTSALCTTLERDGRIYTSSASIARSSNEPLADQPSTMGQEQSTARKTILSKIYEHGGDGYDRVRIRHLWKAYVGSHKRKHLSSSEALLFFNEYLADQVSKGIISMEGEFIEDAARRYVYVCEGM